MMDFNDLGLPLMQLNTGPSDFDYGGFLQGEDVDYFAEESSASTGGPLQDTSGQTELVKRTSPSTSHSNSHSNSPSKQRLERRGHTKSRRGCYNCKRRRIKVIQARSRSRRRSVLTLFIVSRNPPSMWPLREDGPHVCIPNSAPDPASGMASPTFLVQNSSGCVVILTGTSATQPQHQIPLFSLQDMRFFQHFLLQCYPSHPLGNEQIWTHEVPCLSQNVSKPPNTPLPHSTLS